MKNYLSFLAIAIIGVLLAPNIVLSQSTPEQLETQKRLNEVEINRASSEASVSAKKTSTATAFLEGSISSKTNSVIVLSSSSGVKTISTSDSTKFINIDSKGKKLIGFGDLKIGETILLVGLSPQGASGVAKIVVRDQNQKPKYFSLFGKNQELKDNVLTLKNSFQSNSTTSKVQLGASTVFRKNSKNITLEQVALDERLVVTGTIDEKGNLNSSEVLIF